MLILYGFVIMAAMMDIRSRRISNKLILVGIGIGLIRRFCSEGSAGLLTGVIHILLPILFLYLLFLMGALGAGDIKLFSLIGVFVNLKKLTVCVMASFIIGALWSGVRLIRRCFCGRKLQGNTLPFAVAILGGLIIATFC